MAILLLFRVGPFNQIVVNLYANEIDFVGETELDSLA